METAWWGRPVIPALRRLKPEYLKSEASSDNMSTCNLRKKWGAAFLGCLSAVVDA